MATREKRPSVARQNVSTACTQCRSSKLKCDGNLPKCKRCDVKKRECIYPSADDKRRVTLKKALEVFVRRVQQLDQFVACQGLVAPSIRPEDREIFDKVMGGRESSPLTSSSCVSYQSRGELGSGSISADHAMQSTALSDLASGTKYNSLLPDGVDLLAQNQHPVGLPQAALICNAAPDIQPDGTSGVQLDNLEMSSSYSQDGPMVPITTYDSSNPFRYPFYNPDLGPESGLTHPTDFRDSGHNDFLEDDEDLISQLSNRMGHLHLMEDGQWRFFGATSNWNLAKQRFYNDTLANVPSTSQILPQPVVAREPLDPQLELQLENLYFTWQDPCYHVVDRVMYEEGKVRWKTSQQSSTFYSPLLANAICAFGALFHKPRRRANELSQACASTARILLDIELDAPKVATAQALVILSSLEAAATKDARGWLYCGMAMRLSFDLGLHVDMEPYVALGQMTASEAKARCTAFWGCYVVDHLWGFYLGRPFHTNSGNITVHKPSANLYSRQQQTSTEVALGSLPVEDAVSKSFHEEVELMSAQWVFLGESMDALGNVMYGCNAVSKEDLVQVASNTMKNLIQWKQNLPPGLAIDIDNPSACPKAHLIVLHMQYYQIMIFIHRPFISEERNALGPLHGVTAQTSRSACLEAAFAISKLVGIYEKNYTLQRINIQAVSIIFSAALFLVFENISPTPSYDRETLAVHLEVCSQALAKLGEYFENASRSLDLLLSIKRDWKARLVAGNSWRIKRRRTSRFSVGTMSSKTKFQATGIEAGDDLHDGENAYPIDSVFHDFDLIDSADWRYAVDDYCKASSS